MFRRLLILKATEVSVDNDVLTDTDFKGSPDEWSE
jgi:hypothetical protein